MIVGRLGKRKDGQLFVAFCREHGFTIKTTYGTQAKKRHTCVRPHEVLKKQTGFILVNQWFQKSLKRCKPIPQPDCGNDHNLVAGILDVKYCREIKHTAQQNKKDWGQPLVNTKYRRSFAENVDCHLADFEEITWPQVQNAMRKASEHFTKQIKRKRKNWVTDEIMEPIERRDQL